MHGLNKGRGIAVSLSDPRLSAQAKATGSSACGWLRGGGGGGGGGGVGGTVVDWPLGRVSYPSRLAGMAICFWSPAEGSVQSLLLLPPADEDNLRPTLFLQGEVIS